jgi:receptor protein-tyrosine kinase
MSIIEQAARRLEELKRAGVVIAPAPSPASHAPHLTPVARPVALTPVGATGLAPDPVLPSAAVLGASAAMAAMAGSSTAREAVPNAWRDTSVPVPAVPLVPALPAVPARRSREVKLDLEALAFSGYLVPGQNRTALAEQMRIVKRPLLANARGEGAEPVQRANLIQVVSALPGEGKTFVAMNLAMSIAMEVDHSVLLVDADVLRPSVLARLGLDAAPGLMDVLSDPTVELADVMLRTNVPKLTLLPAGTASLRSTELLASTAMETLLDELASKYSDRIIVFDAPPLIPTTESRVLASRVGQVVMVVEADATTRAQAAQAYAAVEHCPVVLSVLNKSSQRSAEAYGYYYTP